MSGRSDSSSSLSRISSAVIGGLYLWATLAISAGDSRLHLLWPSLYFGGSIGGGAVLAIVNLLFAYYTQDIVPSKEDSSLLYQF